MFWPDLRFEFFMKTTLLTKKEADVLQLLLCEKNKAKGKLYDMSPHFLRAVITLVFIRHKISRDQVMSRKEKRLLRIIFNKFLCRRFENNTVV
jgi:hypothetical protein